MEWALLILVLLVGFRIVLRFANDAAANSAKEESRREILREDLRRKRIDELYGRGDNNENR